VGFAAALHAMKPQTDADRAYLADYSAQGYPPVHHSEAFREAYAPAYRVVPLLFGRAAQVFAWVDRGAGAPLRLLAIDGPCASGKTTLAAALSRVYGSSVLHMDHFFLQLHQRTAERFDEPGGNMDRERFAREVLAPLRAGRSFTYRPYDCGVQALADPVGVRVTPLCVIEGVYSQHPDLQDAYDARVFMDIDPALQKARLLARNGEAGYRRFVERWIPLEQRYFDAFDVRARADFVVESL
jgi:uridine kinase